MSAMKTARQNVLFMITLPSSVLNEIVVERTVLRLEKASAESTSAPLD